MKQKSFFSLLVAFLFVASTNLMAQRGSESTAAVEETHEDALMAGHAYKFGETASSPAAVEGELKIETDESKGEAIGSAVIDDCEGMIYLPDGVTMLSKATSLIFRPNEENKNCKTMTIYLKNTKDPGVQVKVAGGSATLNQID